MAQLTGEWILANQSRARFHVRVGLREKIRKNDTGLYFFEIRQELKKVRHHPISEFLVIFALHENFNALKGQKTKINTLKWTFLIFSKP